MIRSSLARPPDLRSKRWWRLTGKGRWYYLAVQHPLLRSARALLSTSAGCMGLDVPRTKLVIICSSPKSAWEFSQEVKKKDLDYMLLCYCPSHTWAYGDWHWAFRWAEQGGVEISLYAFFFARKAKRLHLRWSPIWNQTALLASKRGWLTYLHSRIPMVRLYSFIIFSSSPQQYKL